MPFMLTEPVRSRPCQIRSAAQPTVGTAVGHCIRLITAARGSVVERRFTGRKTVPLVFYHISAGLALQRRGGAVGRIAVSVQCSQSRCGCAAAKSRRARLAAVACASDQCDPNPQGLSCGLALLAVLARGMGWAWHGLHRAYLWVCRARCILHGLSAVLTFATS